MSYSWQELEEIYEKVLDIEPDKREAFINNTCGDNIALRDDLLKMVKQENEADKFFVNLQKSVANSFSDIQTTSFEVGTQIGKYSIIDTLAQGGMGTVYLAERADGQFDQKVAIKVYSHLKWSENAENSFKQEQQILATLHHPNIAQIYDGGSTKDDAAYFIMEYVDGLPIDQFVHQHNYSIKNRLDLFKTVCRTLEYAHRNFILHKDIKPNNILVTKEKHVKLLDFGISSMLSESEANDPNQGQVVATPFYASPEQWNGGNITTRSDIYQMGLLLYKILVDTSHNEQPLNTHTRASIGLPSTHATTVIQEINSDRDLPKDIKDIISRALKENPEERYQSPGELLQDIERYENHYPVKASHKGKIYHLGKYLKRNRLAVASISAVFVILLTSLFISIWQANIAKQERDKAEQVSTFLKDIFNTNDPYNQEDSLTAHELLERGADKIHEQELPAQTKAEFLSIIGQLYVNLGYWGEASPYFRNAYDLIQNNNLDDELLLVKTLSDLGGVYRNNSKYKKADSLFILTQKTISNAESLEKPNFYLGEALKDQAQVNSYMGQYDKAIELINESIAIMSKHTEKDSSVFSSLYNVKASILRSLSKYDSAKIFQQRAMDIAKKHNDIAMLNICYNNMGIICQKLGDYTLAEQYFVKSLQLKSEDLSQDHPSIATTLTNIGGTYYKLKLYKKADSVYQKALNIFLKQFGEDHNRVVTTRYNLANVSLNLNRFKEALHQYNQVLKIDTASLGKMHPYVAGDYANIGKCYTYLKKFDKAKATFDKTMNIYDHNFDTTHQKISYSHSLYGLLYEEQDKYELASLYYKMAYDLAKNNLGEDHPYTKEYYTSWQQNRKKEL